MSKIAYISKKFSPGSLQVIESANKIISNYQTQGLLLTLRQLYYRFVAAGLISNQLSEYKRLSSIINNGRLAGLIDWESIEDRGRNLNRISAWENPGDIIRSCAYSYAIDLWADQEYRVEVWVEKQALEAVIKNAASGLSVPSYACKGYMSQSEMWRAAQRLLHWQEQGYTPVIIHLGDHDPSGIDMTRDIHDRLELFDISMKVNRIALNMDQVQQYNPPPNPAKLTDSRVKGYIASYGRDSWELDALEPSVLHELIQDTIKEYLDQSTYDVLLVQQEKERELLEKTADEWNSVTTYLSNKK